MLQHIVDVVMQVDAAGASHVGALGWLVLRVEMLHRRNRKKDRAQDKRITAIEKHLGLSIAKAG